MPTAIGTNTLTSLVDRYLVDEIVDNVYKSNALFFRLLAGNKKSVQGGTQIEQPVILSDFDAGGFYQGLESLPMSMQDTIRNAVWDWKQCYVPIMFDGLTLIKADSPTAIANLVKTIGNQAQMRMAEVLGNALWTTGGPVTGGTVAGPTGAANSLDGIPAIVDDATVATTYGGISRSTYTNWKAYRDNAAAALSVNKLNTAFMGAQYGGQTPSIIVSGSDAYRAYYSLGYATTVTSTTTPVVQHSVSAGTIDNQLFNAGFQNVLFNGVPWVADEHVVADLQTTGVKPIWMLNESFYDLVVSPRADMYMEPFQTPITQDAIAAKILWAGNLTCSSPRTNAVISNWS